MAAAGANESFSGLLLRYRVRTRLTQSQIAERVGVHVRSIQSWECRITHPGVDSLRALISVFFHEGALGAGLEAAEAENIWNAAVREAPRTRVPFDSVWFNELLNSDPPSRGNRLVANARAIEAELAETPIDEQRREDWGDAPDPSDCIGRVRELATLREWVLESQCRVVQLFGMGGIGKTTLAALLAKDLASRFALVFWRNARFGTTSCEWLTQAIRFLAGAGAPIPVEDDERIGLLLQLLRERRCLLILDNLESLLEPFDCEGRFRAGFDGYRRMLQAIAETRHQSCLIVTSREGSPDLALLTGGPVRSLELDGLTIDESRAVVRDRHLSGTDEDWADFVKRCGGNALLLKLTSETVRSVFSGRIDEFLLAVGSNSAIHGGARRLLMSQLDERLSPVEHEVLRLLALSEDAVTPARLLTDIGKRVGAASAIEALQGLRRRSLLEPSDAGNGIRLHSVARDYVIGQFAESNSHAFDAGD